MSVRVMSWVWEHSRAEGTDRLVLLAIADAASDDGGNSYKSIATLSKKTRVSRRTVQRSIAALVDLGELRVKLNGGQAGSNMYRVVMRQSDTPDNVTPLSDSHPRQSDTASSSHTDSVTVTPPLRQPDAQTVLEPSKNRPATTDVVATRKRGTRIPPNWRPSETARAWTLQRIPSDVAAAQLEKFRNHWSAKSGRDATKLDWDATWRNWVLGYLERNPTRPATTGTGAKVAGWLELGKAAQ